jgi:hypothetical protein
VNGVPTTVGNADIQMGALGGNTNLFFCAGGTLTQRLKLESNGNFTVMTGTFRTTDPTLPHSVGGITLQNQNISAASLTINGVPYAGGVAAGVATINSLSGAVTLTAGTNISLYTSGNSIVIGVSGSTGGSSGGVTTLNTLSGALTLSAGTNISLFTSGSDIIITSTISGTYGGVQLSSNTVTASSVITPGNFQSSIGGIGFLGNAVLSASQIYTSPQGLENIIGGVTLQSGTVNLSMMTATDTIVTTNLSVIGGAITICGNTADSIVSTVNGYGGGITISGGTGIQIMTQALFSSTGFTIDTSPIPVSVRVTAEGIVLPTTGRGDIFLYPRDYAIGTSVPLNFPADFEGVLVGTSWRITNSSISGVNFTYNTALATLPNLDPTPSGAFTLSAFYSILLVKTDLSTTYYNVNN